MRTDPRNACKNVDEKLLWGLLHDLIAHPLMAITGYSKLSLRFHDYTSYRAWPRVSATPRYEWVLHSPFGDVTVSSLGNNVYSVQHPRVKHAYVTTAQSAHWAALKAGDWFKILADEFGGVFYK